jgi:cysteine synthase A
VHISNGVVAAVGHTPLIKLRRASEETGCTILGKAEFMNPGQSVKDRAALFIIQDAIKRGALRPGGTVVEGTAGNTGIGLTVIGNALGFRTVIVIPETQSQEKKDALRLLGAHLVEVPALPYKNPNNYVHYSQRLAESLAKTEPNGAIWANQWDNTANRRAHIEGTSQEIWADTDGKVDGFVSAVGSGGTLGGCSDGLKAKRKDIRIALADVPGAALYSYFTTGVLKAEGSSITEGIGQGRVTKNIEGAVGRSRLPHPGRRIRAGLLPAARGRRAVPRRLIRRQRGRRHPPRQGDGARAHHRHAAVRLRHALPVQAIQPGVPQVEEFAGARLARQAARRAAEDVRRSSEDVSP